MPVTPDQITPYWDPVNQQFLGPGNVVGGGFEAVSEIQAVAATLASLPLGIAGRAGKILAVRVAAVTAPTGNATYSVDFRKNGATMLSAPVVLDNTYVAARSSKLGALLAAALVNNYVQPGDFFEVAITNTPGTGAAPANIFFQVDMVAN